MFFKLVFWNIFPIVVFVVLQFFYSEIVAMTFAGVVGILELLYIFLKERRIDKFILFDIFLLLVLTGISVATNNDIFFKLKSVPIEIVFIGMFLVFYFKPDFAINYMSHFFPLSTEKKAVIMANIDILKRQFLTFALLTAVHILTVVYTAFYSSNTVWGIVKAFGLYILMGVYLLFVILFRKIASKN